MWSHPLSPTSNFYILFCLSNNLSLLATCNLGYWHYSSLGSHLLSPNGWVSDRSETALHLTAWLIAQSPPRPTSQQPHCRAIARHSWYLRVTTGLWPLITVIQSGCRPNLPLWYCFLAVNFLLSYAYGKWCPISTYRPGETSPYITKR